MKYTGWVPSVVGRLSFTTYRSELTGTSDEGRVDWVFELETRDLLDTIALLPPASQAGKFFREHIARNLFGISGRFLFAYISEYDETKDRLVGQVHVVSEALQRRTVEELKSVSADEIPTCSDARVFMSKNAPTIVGSDGYWVANVNIYRTGQVNIDTGASTQLTDARQDDEIIAEQIYYFIKDLFHNHQHHDPKSDSLISICKVDNFSDTNWIDTVHHALFRSIIRYKRYQTENHISKSLGILAYTGAFERTFRTQGKLKIFQTDQLKESLRVAQDDARNKRNMRAAFAESVKSTFFAFFAFLVSMSFLLRFQADAQISVDATIFKLSKSVMENFWPSLGIVGITAFIIGIWTHSIDPGRIPLIREVTRVFQGLRLRYFVIVNLFITITLVSLGWYLLFGLT